MEKTKIHESAARLLIYISQGMKCSQCPMTILEHIEKYGLPLDIHYTKDCSKSKLGWKKYKEFHRKLRDVNSFEDFLVLCRPCHADLHGIKQHKIPQEKWNYIAEEYQKGRTMRGIADEFHVGKISVWSVLVRMGILRRQRGDHHD
jgi:hypothetical protein